MKITMKPGMSVTYRLEDEPASAQHRATVLNVKVDHQPEIEQYINDAVHLRDDDAGASEKTILFLFGTDSEYYLDGKKVIILGET